MIFFFSKKSEEKINYVLFKQNEITVQDKESEREEEKELKILCT